MNYLAHLFLADGDEELIVGNFIADTVKGSRFKNFTGGIANGILLHRHTDYFCDRHPMYLKTIHRLAPRHGKFSGIITDMLYDHLLASLWRDFSHEKLEDFCKRTYSVLYAYQPIMPDDCKTLLSHMIRHNWLASYATIDGIETALRGLSRRMKYFYPLQEALKDFQTGYKYFEDDFKTFFPLVQRHVKSEILPAFEV